MYIATIGQHITYRITMNVHEIYVEGFVSSWKAFMNFDFFYSIQIWNFIYMLLLKIKERQTDIFFYTYLTK